MWEYEWMALLIQLIVMGITAGIVVRYLETASKEQGLHFI